MLTALFEIAFKIRYYDYNNGATVRRTVFASVVRMFKYESSQWVCNCRSQSRSVSVVMYYYGAS